MRNTYKHIVSQEDKKEKQPTLITFSDYQKVKENAIDLNNPVYKATSIIRFQILILELLEKDGFENIKDAIGANLKEK